MTMLTAIASSDRTTYLPPEQDLTAAATAATVAVGDIPSDEG